MSDLPPDPTEARPVIAGKYKIVRQIGAGGYGMVFEATQLDVGRTVALKLLLPDLGLTDRFVERFTLEAQLARRLEHPNTVRLYDWGKTEKGELYIAWQFLVGRELTTALDEDGPFDEARTRHIGLQVLKSLMEAHALGIVHRDIKPANIFLCEYAGASDFVKLLDFGIAKATGPETGPSLTARHAAVPKEAPSESLLTEAGEIMGTPAYMAPEQVTGQAITPATDLYAVGLVLAELMTGETVMLADSYVATIMGHVNDDPVYLPEWLADRPIGQVILRATQKKAEERYPSAQAMHDDLHRLQLAAIDGGTPSSTGGLRARAALAVTTGVEARGPDEGGHDDKPAAPSHAWRWKLAVVAGILILAGVVVVAALVVASVGGIALYQTVGSSDSSTAREKAALEALDEAGYERLPRDVNARKFDAVAFLPTALARARKESKGAKLVQFYATEVDRHGKQDLKRSVSVATVYYFLSPRDRKRDLCRVRVIVTQFGMAVAREGSFLACKDKPVSPTCSMARVRKRAAPGVPRKKLATVSFGPTNEVWSLTSQRKYIGNFEDCK